MMEDPHSKKSFDAERFRAMLREDTADAYSDDALLEVVSRLKRWEMPAPGAEATSRLLERLTQEMPPAENRFRSAIRRGMEWWPLLLLRSQVRVVRREIWAASALVILLGTMVTLISTHSNAGSGTPIAIIAPLVAAVGVALLYDSDIEQILELEDATPASARILLLARLTLVFGFDLVIALGGSICLALIRADILLWPLVLSWLVPMTFLSALAFFLSVLSGDAIAGSLAALMIWGGHLLFQAVGRESLLAYLLSLPGLSSPETRPLLFGLAPLLVGLALWWVGHHERKIGDWN